MHPLTKETSDWMRQKNKDPAIIHVEQREAVKELLTLLKATTMKRASLKEKIDQTVLEEIETYDSRIKVIKEEIKDLVCSEVQESIKTNDGEAIYKKGNVRISYDRKILDAIQDGNIRKAIEPARKETQVKGSVTIETH